MESFITIVAWMFLFVSFFLTIVWARQGYVLYYTKAGKEALMLMRLFGQAPQCPWGISLIVFFICCAWILR
jgi:hypothetical protein